MYAWYNIGRSICCVKPAHHINKNIISAECLRSQIQSIRKYCRYHNEECHSGNQKSYKLSSLFFILDTQPADCNCHISEPHQIRYDKILTKRYISINSKMNNMIGNFSILQIVKSNQINHCIKSHDCQSLILVAHLSDPVHHL